MHSVPSNFWQWYTSLSEDSQAIIPVFGAMLICVVLTIIATTIYKIHKTRTEDALKRELLDRGMSAEEIATIIAAKSEKKCLPPGWKST
jgi:hypothetical protein